MLLTEKEYSGIVLGEPDPKNIGRYKVYIPEMMSKLSNSSDGIWVQNEIHKHKFHRYVDTKARISDEDASYGSYMPLQPGTRVFVLFKSESMDSGYIDRIASFDTIPGQNANRDNFYLALKTTKGSWIYVDEELGIMQFVFHNGKVEFMMTDEFVQLYKGEPKAAGKEGVLPKSLIHMDNEKIVCTVEDNTFTEIKKESIKLSVNSGSSSIFMDPNTINIRSANVKINGESAVHLKGADMQLNASSFGIQSSSVDINTGITNISGPVNLVGPAKSSPGTSIAVDGLNYADLEKLSGDKMAKQLAHDKNLNLTRNSQTLSEIK